MTLIGFLTIAVAVASLTPPAIFNRGLQRTVSPGQAANNAKEIYDYNEVDKPAHFKNADKVLSDVQSALKCEGEGVINLSFVFHKSGKVTDVKIEHTMLCVGEKQGVNTLRKAKFTHAIKNGARVSQYGAFEVKVELRGVIG